MKYWIKERHNPQLGVYYVACGQISDKAARAKENKTLYGTNYMFSFATKEAYEAELERLKNNGERVQ